MERVFGLGLGGKVPHGLIRSILAVPDQQTTASTGSKRSGCEGLNPFVIYLHHFYNQKDANKYRDERASRFSYCSFI